MSCIIKDFAQFVCCGSLLGSRCAVAIIEENWKLTHNVAMPRKKLDRDKILGAFISVAFEKSAGAVSLADIACALDVKKASLYNHFSSREEMYNAAVEFCADYLGRVSFSFDRRLDLPLTIAQYFRSHTLEPLLQVYSFIHGEKYFNQTASLAASRQKEKITSDIAKLLSPLLPRQKNLPQVVGALVASSLDDYVLQRKEALRKSPGQMAGGLFELPFEESTQERLISLVSEILEHG